MQKFIITGLISMFGVQGMAQNDIDAIRYTNKKFGSTAKSLSIGGAVGALGADISTASINPAGLAHFKKGEFSFSLGFNNTSNTSSYLDNQLKDNTFNMFIPNVGLVFTKKTLSKKGEAGWKNYTVGFNSARVSDFNRVINFDGINTKTSFADYFAERAEGYSVNQLLGTDDDFDFGFSNKTTMAYEAYLFDSVGNRKYASYASPIFHNIYQKNIMQQSGGMNEYNFSLAGNYNDVVYLGATLCYTAVNFEENKSFSETNDPENTAANTLDNFTFSENLTTTGGGFSARLGVIVKANKFARVGVSFQTPQVINLSDAYNFSVVSTLRNGDFFDYKSKEGAYDYSLLTPGRYTLSASAIVGKYGFLSADFEKVDYSAMRLRSSDGNTAMENANDVIRANYVDAINYRIGGELVIDEYRLRGGYANYGSALRSNTTKPNTFITGGFGIKEKTWALDLGVVHSLGQDVFQPYVLNNKSVDQAYSTNKFSSNSVVLTLTTKF